MILLILISVSTFEVINVKKTYQKFIMAALPAGKIKVTSQVLYKTLIYQQLNQGNERLHQ